MNDDIEGKGLAFNQKLMASCTQLPVEISTILAFRRWNSRHLNYIWLAAPIDTDNIFESNVNTQKASWELVHCGEMNPAGTDNCYNCLHNSMDIVKLQTNSLKKTFDASPLNFQFGSSSSDGKPTTSTSTPSPKVSKFQFCFRCQQKINRLLNHFNFF